MAKTDVKRMKQIENLVYSPARSFSELVSYLQRLEQHPGITWGIPCVDRICVPMRPGDLVSIIGRPGAGKTSLLAYLARREAHAILERKTQETECVVFVTWEQSVPELELLFQVNEYLSLSDLRCQRITVDDLIRHGKSRAYLPIFIIGTGYANADTIPMTPDVVFEAIDFLYREYRMRPTLMLFDYVQLIPVRPVREKWLQVYEAVNACKRLAIRIGCPIVIAAQATRDVDSRKDRLPGLGSGQMSSAIEQASDKVFGITRPYAFGDPADLPLFVQDKDGFRYPVNENLLIVQLVKQRMGPSFARFFLYFDPDTLTLGEMVPL